MKKVVFFISIVMIILPSKVLATSGALKASTIKECDGTLYGMHGSDNHWHVALKNEVGGYSAIGEALETDPCSPQTNTTDDDYQNIHEQSPSQNNDSSLKEVVIDGETIKIAYAMEYKTTKENISIDIKASDDEAKLEYNKIDNLELGNNIINIKVTAQDGTEEKYILIIVREKDLNNDTSIEIKIDEEVIEFLDNKYEIEVKNTVKSLNITYKLNDDNSHVEIIGNEDFVTGKNVVKIIVTAENGESEEYIITVIKLDFINSIIKIVLGSSIVVAIITFIKKYLINK